MTFVDTDLDSGERIYLPTGQDLPIVCFRFEENLGKIKLIHTDKLGNIIKPYDLEGMNDIMAEYHIEVKHWFVLKHEINRIFFVPLTKEKLKGKIIDFVRDYYLAKQKFSMKKQSEIQVRIYKLGEKFSIQI